MSKLQINNIVKFKDPAAHNLSTKHDAYFRIRSIRGTWCNLVSPFGSRKCIMRFVPLADLVECENEWYSKWQQTETYQCM
jgi:hypothetical protein